MLEKLTGHEIPTPEPSTVESARKGANRQDGATAPVKGHAGLPPDRIQLSVPEVDRGQGEPSSDQKPNRDETLRDQAEQREQIRELRKLDREVRREQNAHAAVAGRLAPGQPDFEYEVGPDGRRYVTDGDVRIRIPTGRTEEETLRNAEQAYRAATAPPVPSSGDRAVARLAHQILTDARSSGVPVNPDEANLPVNSNGAGLPPDPNETAKSLESPPPPDASPERAELGDEVDRVIAVDDVDHALVANGTNHANPVVEELEENSEKRQGTGDAGSMIEQKIREFGKASGDAMVPEKDARFPGDNGDSHEESFEEASPMQRAIEAYGSVMPEPPEPGEEADDVTDDPTANLFL